MMKNLRKVFAALLCLAMLLSVSACGGDTGDNTAPEITGVKDQAVQAGTEFDALAGVAASDKEDGDVTSKIVITSMPSLDFKNGKATPTNPGDYELTYTVTDKGGLETKAYATLTVTRQTGEAVILHNFDFSTQTPDSHGWAAKVADGVNATGEQKQGAFVFDITDPGNSDGDIKLVKAGVKLKAADYKIKIWAKSTKETFAHILVRDENAEDWKLFGEAWNVRIGTEIAPYEVSFTSSGEGSAELLFHLGKITPNDTEVTPSDFTVTIDKIEIYETSGEEHAVPVYTSDLSAGDALAISAGDGAEASASAGVFQINSYPTDGGVWSIKADILLPGVTIEKGEKYYYRFTLKADAAQPGECLVESAEQADAARANFNGLSAPAGEEIVVSNVFTAENSVSDPVIRMQIGNPADGVTGNAITVSNLEFGKMEGDLEIIKDIDAFGMNIAESGNPNNIWTTNPDYIWATYNGTDEDNDRGVGTIWTENGSLFYRIDQGGTVDWHNKLIIGHSKNPLTLPSDSYFTVEITAKASKPVYCRFALNVAGGWDPRLYERIDFTTEEQTFSFTTTDTLILDMDFEMLFQFGSAETAELGEVTIEFTNITIWQSSVV